MNSLRVQRKYRTARYLKVSGLLFVSVVLGLAAVWRPVEQAFAVPPTVTSVTPNTNISGGETITVVGTGLTNIQHIAGSGEQSFAIDGNGKIYAWGYGRNGELGNGQFKTSATPVEVTMTGVLSGKTITQLAVGEFHVLALASDGTVYAWGNGTNGELGNGTWVDSNVPVAVNTAGVLAGKTITQIAASYSHSMALASDGTVYTWGSSWYGELGDGTYNSTNVPVAVNTAGALAGKTITQIAAGYESNHSLALASDGSLYAWGDNAAGELGNGNFTESTLPVAVDMTGVLAGKTITRIDAGNQLSMAIDSTGAAYVWGAEYLLGRGLLGDSNVPIALNTSGVLAGKSIDRAAIRFHAMTLTTDGELYGWGGNFYGEVGNGNSVQQYTPVAVSTSGVLAGKKITQIAAGYHTLALASDGTLYGWGYNGSGAVGNGISAQRLVPGPVVQSGVLAGKTVTKVAAGGTHSLALTSEGRVYAWGSNFNGQLGNNSSLDSGVPVPVSTSGVLSGKTIVDIATKADHSLAIDSDGVVYSWGDGISGQLGNAGNADSPVPVAVSTSGLLSGKTITDIAAGRDFSVVRTSDNGLYAWGEAASGRLGNNSTVDSNVPVAVTMSGVLSGKTITQIASGGTHTLALASDGTAFAWGAGTSGQLGNSASSNSLVPVAVTMTGALSGKTVTDIAAGYAHSLVIASDQRAYAWGLGTGGRLGNGGTATVNAPSAVSTAGVLNGVNIVDIDGAGGLGGVGGLYSVALSDTGAVYTWGNGNAGELGVNDYVLSSVPVAVNTTGSLAGVSVDQVVAGASHPVVLSDTANMYTWGSGGSGQLGNAYEDPDEPVVSDGGVLGTLVTVPTITVGGIPATGVTIVDDTEVTFTAPISLVEGDYAMNISFTDGRTYNLPDAMTYGEGGATDPPATTPPSSGTSGGTTETTPQSSGGGSTPTLTSRPTVAIADEPTVTETPVNEEMDDSTDEDTPQTVAQSGDSETEAGEADRGQSPAPWIFIGIAVVIIAGIVGILVRVARRG